MELHLSAVMYHLTYGITHCYLLPDTTSRLEPNQGPVLDLRTLEGWKAELS